MKWSLLITEMTVVVIPILYHINIIYEVISRHYSDCNLTLQIRFT